MAGDIHHPTELTGAGLLRVADGSLIYWETSGNPAGKPALYLHGGPGSSLGRGSYRRHFDPRTYRLVGIDQRGCGRSRPLADEAPGELGANTTQALIGDIEAVRQHLGIEKWLVSGVSWGTTLALAYAQQHPERVSELVLVAVTTTSREEVDWITEGVGRVFPEAWQEFECASGRREGERVVDAYARRLATGNREDRLRAARDWSAWEAAHASFDVSFDVSFDASPGSNGAPAGLRFDAERGLTFATLVTHYWSNDGFLRDGREILRRVGAIAHIPAVLIHGRRDIGSPAITAWRLHRLWPASRLDIVETDGHGGPRSWERMRLALDAFAR